MNIRQFENEAGLNEALARFLADDIQLTLATKPRYTIALSGGSTPKTLYHFLAKEYKHKIDWSRVHVFFDDERYVPFEDERSNAKMVFTSLINEVPIPLNQVHVMRTDVASAASAAAYQAILHHYFDGQAHTFDMVLLGMGDDGHTLSLFPQTPAVNEVDKWATEVVLEAGVTSRITLTAPVVNLAAKVIFMVTGSGKAQTLNAVINGPYQPNKLPAQIIQPASKNLYWFIDAAAAQQLPAV